MNICADMIDSHNDIAILVEAARLYYQHDLSQAEIARKMGVSRPSISRLLQRAREEGIVRIEVRDPLEKGTRQETELQSKFGLKKVIIVPADPQPQVRKHRLGQAAVTFLESLATDNLVLGVSWGTTMQEIARQLSPKEYKNMVVVQLNGGVSKAAYDTHASEIAQVVGEKYNATPYLLPLPAIVDSQQLKQAIVSDKNIARTLNLARQATVALYTIGLFSAQSLLVKADYFDATEVAKLLDNGAVGDICSRIINGDGQICSASLDERTIGINLDDLAAKPYAVAIAGGEEKLPAIRAALNGQRMNCLITDDAVAAELLRG